MSKQRRAVISGLVVGVLAAAIVGLMNRSSSDAAASFFGCFIGMYLFSILFNSTVGTGTPLHNRVMEAAQVRQARKRRSRMPTDDLVRPSNPTRAATITTAVITFLMGTGLSRLAFTHNWLLALVLGGAFAICCAVPVFRAVRQLPQSD